MRFIKPIICLTAVLSAFSCDSSLLEQADVPQTHTLSIAFGDSSSGVKSAALQSGQSDSSIKEISLFVFRKNGELAESYFIDSPSSKVDISLEEGQYDIYALSNVSDLTKQVKSHTDYSSLLISLPQSMKGIPMRGELHLDVSGYTDATVPMSRLMAKYTLKINRSKLPAGASFKATSVGLRNAAAFASPETPFKAAQASQLRNGDTASASDIQALNNRQQIVLYVGENMQGKESGITRSKDKTPSYRFRSVNIACCTFLEIAGVYTDSYNRSFNIAYRMYLGSDNTSDFNIARNKEYNLTFIPGSADPYSSSWKCEPSLNYQHEFSVSPRSLSLTVGESTSLSGILSTKWYSDYLDYDDVTSYCSWSSSNSAVATVSGGLVRAVGSGRAYIYASYSGSSDYAIVDVSEPYYPTISHSLEVSPSAQSVNEGESASYTATWKTFSDGELTSSVNVSSSANWSVTSGSDVAKSNGSGSFTGLKAGNATLRASYSGYTADASLTVIHVHVPEITHSLEVSPASQSVNEGESASYTATWKTFSDGELTSSVNVSSSANWSVTSGSDVAKSNGAGSFTGLKAGNATLRASYSGYTADASLSVKAIPVVPVSVSISGGASEMQIGESIQLSAAVSMSNGSTVRSGITWRVSSGTSVSVDSNGKVTANSLTGSSTVQASYTAEGKTVTADIQIRTFTYFKPEIYYSGNKVYVRSSVGSGNKIYSAETATVSFSMSAEAFVDCESREGRQRYTKDKRANGSASIAYNATAGVFVADLSWLDSVLKEWEWSYEYEDGYQTMANMEYYTPSDLRINVSVKDSSGKDLVFDHNYDGFHYYWKPFL